MKYLLLITLLFLDSYLILSQETTRVFPPTGQVEKLLIDSLTNCIKAESSNALALIKRGEIIFNFNINNPPQWSYQLKKRVSKIDFSNDDAFQDIKKAISIAPNNPQFYKILSDYYFFVKDNLDSAILEISMSIKIDSLNADWYQRRGFLNAKAYKWDKACEDWKMGSTMTGEEANTCKRFYDQNCKN